MGLDQSLERAVESVAQLRAVNYPEHRDTVFNHANNFMYRFNSSSFAADDGDNIVKPDTTHPLRPGRWEKTPVGSFPGGGGGSFIENEFVAASNGQTVFNLTATFAVGGLSVLFVNGVGYAEGTDYTIAGTVLTWLDNDFPLEIGDELTIKFQI